MENVIIKLIKERKTFTNDKGEEVKYYQYSLLFNDDLKTPIKPVFNRDKNTLYVMADYVKSKAKDKQVAKSVDKPIAEKKSDSKVEDDDLPF